MTGRYPEPVQPRGPIPKGRPKEFPHVPVNIAAPRDEPPVSPTLLATDDGGEFHGW